MAWKSVVNLFKQLWGLRVGICVGILWFLLFCLLAAFVGVMCSQNPTWAFKRLGEYDKFEVLKFLGIGMGGILLALQALASHRRARAMETAATAQAIATMEQAIANLHTEQGQRQERLKNAIEHLGHASDTVRLGAAYELFHLAEDTPQLRQTVFDILCAHIRRTTGEDEYRKTHKSKPSEQIQSLLTLLFCAGPYGFQGSPHRPAWKLAEWSRSMGSAFNRS